MITYRQIQLVCVMYLATWMIAPPLGYGTLYRLIAVGAAGMWLFLQHYTRKTYSEIGMRNKLTYYLLSVAIYVVATLFCHCIFRHMSLLSAFYNDITTYVLLLIGYIGGVYCRDKRYKELERILIFIIILVVIFSLTSIFRSEEFYYMTRDAGGMEDEAYNALAKRAAMQGVGGFGFFAFSAAFASMVLWYSKFCVGIKKRLLVVAFFVIEIGVFSAGYTLALLISVVGITLCLYFNMRSHYGKIIVICVFVLMMIFWDNISRILYIGLQNIAEGSMYANKVEDIFSFLIEGNSTGTFESRQERYLYSLQSIFRYPVLGSYVLAGINAIGSHSSILDPFASYGWIVGAAWLYIIVIFPYKMMCLSKNKGLSTTIFFSLFFTALFNRTAMVMGIFFLIVPAMVDIQNNSVNKRVKRR